MRHAPHRSSYPPPGTISVPFVDGPDLLRQDTGESAERFSALPRVLWVEGVAPLLTGNPLDDLGVEMVREASARQALERLEADGDFAVIVCGESVSGSSGLDLLGAVRALSP